MLFLTSCHGTTFSGSHGSSSAAHLSFSLAIVTMSQEGVHCRCIWDKQAAIPFQKLDQQSVGGWLEPVVQPSEGFVLLEEDQCSNTYWTRRKCAKRGKARHTFSPLSLSHSMKDMLPSSFTHGYTCRHFLWEIISRPSAWAFFLCSKEFTYQFCQSQLINALSCPFYSVLSINRT